MTSETPWKDASSELMGVIDRLWKGYMPLR